MPPHPPGPLSLAVPALARSPPRILPSPSLIFPALPLVDLGPINDGTSFPRWFTHDEGCCQPCGRRGDSPVTSGLVWQAPCLSLWAAGKDVPPFFFFFHHKFPPGSARPPAHPCAGPAGFITAKQHLTRRIYSRGLRFSFLCWFFLVWS